MAFPLLDSKLQIPQLASVHVSRPRLTEILDAGLDGGCILISAPAGFGKTTLLAEWAHALTRQGHSQPRVAWLSLDADDGDIAHFLAYLAASVQSVKSQVGQGLSMSLQAPGLADPESALVSLLNDVGRLPHKLIVILDDYHVIESSSVDQALTFVIDHLPRQMCLVIGTRTDPSFPLARLRARGQLVELREADLRFTEEEAVTFVDRSGTRFLVRDLVRTLMSRTEGWIAGVKLACLGAQRFGGREQVAAFVSGFGGSNRFIMDYLLDEVLSQQPEHVRQFLLQTSILARISASLARAVTEFTDCQGLLERIESDNLFLIPLDDRREWYRYHQLFADLLQQRMEQDATLSPQLLHSRAMNWCREHGFPSEAIRHAIAAGEPTEAADVLALAGQDMIGRGAFGTVERCSDEIAPELLQERPILYVYQAWAASLSHRLGKIEPNLQLAEEAAAGSGSENLVHGHVCTLRAWNARRRRDNTLATKLLREAISCLGDGRSWVRSFVDLNLGLAYLDQGALLNAAEAFQAIIGHDCGDDNALAYHMAIAHMAAVLILQGRLDEAETLCRDLIAAETVAGQAPPTLCLVFLRLGWVLAERNDLAGYFENVSRGVILADQIGYHAVARAGAWSMSWEGEYLGEQGVELAPLPEAKGIVDRIVSQGISTGDSRPVGLHREEDESVFDQNTRMYLEGDAYFEVWPGFTDHARASDLAKQGRIGEAMSLLDQIVARAETVHGKGLIIEAHTIQALICQDMGDTDRALNYLLLALRLGEPDGYVRTFADGDEPMARLLTIAFERGIMPVYVDHLLKAFGDQDPRQTSEPVASTAMYSQPLVDPLSSRELEVLALIARGDSNQQIADKLFIALSTVKGHNRRIFEKLQVRRRTEAVATARNLGLI